MRNTSQMILFPLECTLANKHAYLVQIRRLNLGRASVSLPFSDGRIGHFLGLRTAETAVDEPD